MKKNPLRILWLILGFAAIGIGVQNRSMTLKTKFSLLLPASGMLLLAFAAMPNWYGRAFIIFLIIFKYVYFFTRIKTIPVEKS